MFLVTRKYRQALCFLTSWTAKKFTRDIKSFSLRSLCSAGRDRQQGRRPITKENNNR